MTRNTTITSGNFAVGEGKKGNFSAYNAKGERIFIHKNQMESLGWKAQKDISFPFCAVIGEKEVGTLDADGNVTDVKVKRLSAYSVFKTAEDLVKAVNADALLDINAKAQLTASAKSAGLTEGAVNALLAASV